MNEQLMMTKREVAKELKCCDRHVDNLRKENRIPQPVELGKRCVRWPRRQIEQWIEAGCPALAV
jgi:predicted DNA-binding transcriptional regulator AlpA